MGKLDEKGTSRGKNVSYIWEKVPQGSRDKTNIRKKGTALFYGGTLLLKIILPYIYYFITKEVHHMDKRYRDQRNKIKFCPS